MPPLRLRGILLESPQPASGGSAVGQSENPGSAGHSAGVDVRELRYFTVLCEELHFGRAAGRLHISQPPLSQTIAQLEQKLGVRLLDRTTRNVTPTNAGQVLSAYARRILGELDDAVGATRRAASAEAGTLKLAVGALIRETMLPPLQYVISKRFPLLTVDVAEELGDEVLRRVQTGAADLGVLVSPTPVDGLESRPLRRERPVALLHRDNPLSRKASLNLADLAELRLVIWPRRESSGSHDLVLGLFNGSAPSSVDPIEMYGAGWWTELRDGAFAVLPEGTPISPEFVAVPIDDAPEEFVTQVVWSSETAPTYLPELLEALEEFAREQAWL
jgi:DNA-binding transcriptional LysR family regulator